MLLYLRNSSASTNLPNDYYLYRKIFNLTLRPNNLLIHTGNKEEEAVHKKQQCAIDSTYKSSINGK